ncbi:MAG: hypothetical protein F7C81_05550 [Desulfurococcales archaeon]|nr:hypothetical protein [Desulfurococcales archaeon]
MASIKKTDKTHMDYAYDLDLVIRPDSTVPVLNREFGAFSGAGIPLFSIGGGVFRAVLSDILVNFHARRGYFIADTPLIASSNLFEVSGHLEFYRKNMFLFDIEGHDFAIKPMNCPYHILIFMHELARYRNKVKLPFKIFEVGRVHRYEPSGSLYGLLRVRGFTQDDAHIITPEDKAVDIVVDVFEEMKMILENVFNLEVETKDLHLRLSLSDKSLIGEEFMGTLNEWIGAENVIEEAASIIEKKYDVSYSKEEGEAAFYGPKIDVVMRVKEAGIEKEWQLGTIQFDFNLPRRFRLYELVRELYGDINIYIIHRALLGSIERFLGVYLEHYRGRLPFSLAPLQIAIIGIKSGGDYDNVIEDHAFTLANMLINKGFRIGVKITNKTWLSGDIRLLETTIKPPLLVFIGESEIKGKFVTLSMFSHNDMKRKKYRIIYRESFTEVLGELNSMIEELESGIVKIAGQIPRIPMNLSHLL